MQTRGLVVLILCISFFIACAYVFFVVFVVCFVLCSISFSTWIGLLLVGSFAPVETVGRITYIVLVQTLNHAQSTADLLYITSPGPSYTPYCRALTLALAILLVKMAAVRVVVGRFT